mmetsp:Transcript_21602/g.32251  ORF Transcript_21602/g.32251 Transcript_21602/m.32251 type:complete len:406 (-) Transcript_21602:106-1323(-)
MAPFSKCFERNSTDSTCGTSVCSNDAAHTHESTTNNCSYSGGDDHAVPVTICDPESFPAPQLGSCKWVRSHSSFVYDPMANAKYEASNVLISHESEYGYWLRGTIRRALFGKVVHAHVLRRRENPDDDCIWEATGSQCAVKLLSWSKIRKNEANKQTLEDPLKEIAAMQYIKRHPDASRNVLTPVEVISDSKHIYVIMPFCKDGELYDRLDRANDSFHEGEARYWFQQILQGIQSLHQAGVCHRDLSLENVLIHGGSCHIIDMGMSLRTPSKKLSSSCGSSPILMPPQGTCGKFFYMAPEIYDNREAFDGFAIDVWSAGAMLFMMLTGAPAFERPTASDPCFDWIMNGRLSEMLDAWNKKLSPEAVNLLEGMLCVNANSRLTLDQVMKHPWVTGEHDVPPPPCAQ